MSKQAANGDIGRLGRGLHERITQQQTAQNTVGTSNSVFLCLVVASFRTVVLGEVGTC